MKLSNAVEGVFDYYAFYKLFQNKDMPCVVSTLGTKLTEEGKNVLLSAGVENFSSYLKF